jgi:hypothetical protein
MSFRVTPTISNLARQQSKEPQIILEIEDIPFIFGARPVETLWTFDENPTREFDTIGLRFDTPIAAVNSVDVISLQGTSKTVTQQIEPDKAGTSSVAAIRIELVDKDRRLSEIFRFGNYVDDLLGKKASVYVSLVGAEHPKDSIPVMQGYIDDYTINHGAFNLSVSHPENLKRKPIYEEYLDKTDAAIDLTQTNIPCLNTAPLKLAQDVLISFIRINDEIMQVTAKTATSLTVIRAQLGTIAQEHDFDSEIEGIYNLSGNPIELALKLYLSDENQSSFGSEEVESFVDIGLNQKISNTIFFKGFNVALDSGVVEGDTIIVTGSASNDGSYLIDEIVQTDLGSYILVNSPLVEETDTNAVVSFRSKYNVLPIGLGLTNREVDVQGHEDILTFNPSQFIDVNFYLDEQVDGKEFIDRELYFPQALYSIPRKAKISAKLVEPPLSTSQIVRLDETTLENIESISVKRSTHKNFYNTVVYRYGYDLVFDKFRRGQVFINENSQNRIRVGTKQIKIESKGLVDSSDTTNLLNRQQQRILDRYKFAAQRVTNVKPIYSEAFNVEVGDIVVFGSDNVQVTDLNTGERQFKSRLMEVVNRSVDITNGGVTLELLESAYDVDSRFGIISLSSLLGAGSTITELVLKTGFDVGEFNFETDKWRDFIGQAVRARSDDYSFDEISTIKEIKGSNRTVLVLDTPLSAAPNENFILEIPEYPASGDLYKDLFVYFNPQVKVTSGISDTSFECDTSLLFEGASVYVSSDDYIRDSFDIEGVEIDNITGSTVTLNKSLGFTPQVGDNIELIGFVSDNGLSYRII